MKKLKNLFKKYSNLYDISFNPFIQDLCAIAIIIENGAIELVKEKKIYRSY